VVQEGTNEGIRDWAVANSDAPGCLRRVFSIFNINSDAFKQLTRALGLQKVVVSDPEYHIMLL